jgi:hypothetical protein
MTQRVGTCTPLVRRPSLVAVLPLLMFTASFSPIVRAQGPAESKPNRVISSPEERLITVWKVGSPWPEGIPDTTVPVDLVRSAERMGYTLKVEAFPARGFTQVFFRALEKHHAPDILAFNNYGIIEGMTTPSGRFVGIGSDESVRRELVQVTESLSSLEGGRRAMWQFLVRTSPNYQAAKRLALRVPDCRGSGEASLPTDLRERAVRITGDYLVGSPELKSLEDSDRLHSDVPDHQERKVSGSAVCGYWAAGPLAFVKTISTYESANALGQLRTLLILRRQQDQWRLLMSGIDPVSNMRFVAQIPQLVSLITKSGTAENTPKAPVLLEPQAGHAPKPPSGEPIGEFRWEPSASPNVIAEIAEFAYKDDARLIAIFPWGTLTTGKLSAGYLWHTGTLWKWRVWSISDAGAVSFSQARSFPN